LAVSLLPPLSNLPFPGSRKPPAGQVLALYTSRACLGHDPGPNHPEQPKRLVRLLRALRNDWMPAYGSRLQVRQPRVDATRAQLLRVHTRQHVDAADGACRRSIWQFGRRIRIDDDTVASAGTQAAARRAAGLVCAAVDDLFGGGNVLKVPEPRVRPSRAFVMVRPPGHHAEADTGPQGFCFFNNVMVGVAHAQAEYGLGRVAILDFDVHHGNGDADIAQMDPTLLYVSSHESPSFPGTGLKGREGTNRNVVNAPLRAGAGSAAFRRAWRERLLPAVRRFGPEAVFVSAGFDAHEDDPLSSHRLSDDDFRWLTAEVAALGKPIVSVLEGGYNVDRLTTSVRAHVDALINA